MARSDNDIQVLTSLPPFVPGNVKGTISVRFPVLKWDCATPPPAPRLNVHLKWWGEKTDGCVFRVPIEYQDKLHPSIKPSVARYNIQSNWRKFRSYLQDMGHLSLVIGLGRTSDDMLVMGECAVPNMAAITPGQLEKRICAVNTSDGTVHLGRLEIELIVKMEDTTLSRKPRRSAGGTSSIGCHSNKMKSFVVASPLKGIETDQNQVNVVSVPVSNKEWRPVKQVKTCSTELGLNEVGKELLGSLIEQTKILHSRVMAATSKGQPLRSIKDKNEENDSVENEDKEKDLEDKIVQDNDKDVPIDLTPPASPSDSMMEIATALACVTEDQPAVESAPSVKPSPRPSKQSLEPPKITLQLPSIHIDQPPPQGSQNIPRPPISFVNCSTKEPELFHLLLEISEGSGLTKSSDPTSEPSTYIQCRLFCLEMPICSKIFTETSCPEFNMKRIFPVLMDWNELLERLQRGYAVIEVWNSSQTKSTENNDATIEDDELIGLVKVSLYPFYAATVCSIQTPSHKQSLFPVVAVDGCCPVRDPLTGTTRGYLNMKLAMGTPSTIPAITLIPPQEEHSISDNQSEGTETTISTEDDDQSNQFIKEQSSASETDNECGRITPVLVPPSSVNTKSVATGNETVKIDLLISQAMHLPLLATPLGEKDRIAPSTYISCHPHPDTTKISTIVCDSTTCPYWDHHCTTDIPQSFIEASFSELEFQVWSLPPQLPNHCTNREGLEVHPKSHIFIGRAYVDLIPLQYGLRTIAGWYNITDLAGEIRGQVKIAVTPHDLVVPRRDMHHSCSSLYSRSLLPIEVELCSSSSLVPTINFAPPTSISIPRSYETGNHHHGNEDQSLSILRQQLQAHVSDLEAIQDSLEAKLKETSFTLTKPHSSVIAPDLTPPISTKPCPPVFTSPTSSSSSASTPIISSLNDSPQSMSLGDLRMKDNETQLTTPTNQHVAKLTEPLTPPIPMPTDHVSSPSTEQSLSPLLTTPTNHKNVEHPSTEQYSITTASPLSMLTTPITSVAMITTMTEATPSFADIDHLISTDRLPIIKAMPSDSNTPPHNYCSTPVMVNETATPTFNTPPSAVINTTPRTNTEAHVLNSSTDELPILKPHPSPVSPSNNESCNGTTDKKLSKEIDRDQEDSSIDLSSEGTTNQISSFINPLATLDEDHLGSSSSDSNIDIDGLRDKVVAMATANNGRNSSNTIAEDTTIIVETTPINDHALKTSDDDLLEEEEEVKKLFNRLLKDGSHLDEEDTSSTDSSNSSTIVLPLSSLENAMNLDPQTSNANGTTQQSSRCYSMSDCSLPDTQLADKLLSLRRSVLSRRPPRPIKPLPPNPARLLPPRKP